MYSGALAVGAQGSITGAANFAPQLTSDIVNYFNKGDLKSAQELQKKLSDIEGAVMQNGIPGIKVKFLKRSNIFFLLIIDLLFSLQLI